MTVLLVQTALLLLGAYFLGAFVGCLVRRTFFARPDLALTAPVAAAEDFAPPVEPLTSGSQFRLPDRAPLRPQIESIPGAPRDAVAPSRSDSSEAEARFKRALDGDDAYVYPQRREEVAGTAPPVPPPAQTEPVRSEWTPPAAPAKPAARDMQPPSPASETQRPEQRSTFGASATSAATAAALAAATAARRSSETSRIEIAPSLPAAAGTSGLTSIAAPVARGEAVAPLHPVTDTVAGSAPPDDLTRVRAIDPALQVKLNALGIRRFADIAGWRVDDVRRVSESLGLNGRIERENWIEQAQILAGGGETAYTRSKVREGFALAVPTADEGERIAPSALEALSRSGAATSGIGAAVAASVASAPPRRSIMALGRDNLQRISQINEEVERLLNVQGVSRYDQIAHWSSSDVTRFEHLLGSDGRISRENWIEQAQILAKGGETAFSRDFDRRSAAEKAVERPRPTQLAEAIRSATSADTGTARRVDYAGLRSIRSEAFRAADAEPVGSAQNGGAAPRADDLKRIRGIGVLIERKLNSMGIRSYEQVANWTRADVDRVSQVLDFRGRIERENWIEQARILASGGQTEFARRADRADPEAPRRR